jgi:MFS family permease
MGVERPLGLGREFAYLWTAYTVSVLGTWIAFDAFSLVAILALHAGPTDVSILAAAGLAVGAAVAVPLGPWVDLRRKRPVMVAMDLTRFTALMSIPAAYALGWLTFAQLLVVAVITAAADITFNAASGAYLKALIAPKDLLRANGRFESTTWTATMLGPPLGGAAIGLFGPVTTVVANAASFLSSAAAVLAIRGREPHPRRPAAHTPPQPMRYAVPSPPPLPATPSPPTPVPSVLPAPLSSADPPRRPQTRDLLDGWRLILTSPVLRPLLLNNATVNALIMAPAPLLAVLMLSHLGFAPWQYGVAFAIPCVGGLIGSRLSRPLVVRFSERRVLLSAGTLRACWSLGLAFVRPGVPGLLLVVTVQLGLVTCAGVFNPVLATYRLNHIDAAVVARTLSAWSVTTKATVALTTALWGVLATATSPRTAIAIAGLLLLATPLFLLRCAPALQHEPELAPSVT